MSEDLEQDLLDGLDEARELADDIDGGVPAGDQPVDSGDTGEPTVSTDIRDRLVEKGFKSFAELKSDDEVLETLESFADENREERVVDKYRPYIDAGREYLQNQEEFEEWRKSRQQADNKPQDPAPAPEQGQPKSKGRPEYDERWEQLCEFNPEIGQFVVKEQFRGVVDTKIGEKLTAHKDWERNQLINVAHNFDDLVNQRVQELLEKRLSEVQDQIPERVKSIVQQSQQVNEYDKYMQDNSGEFWAKDANGQFKTDPLSGEYVMTEKGEELLGYYDEAARYGIQGDYNLRKYAIDKYRANNQAKPDAGEPEKKSPSDVREEKKKSFLVREEIKKNAHSSNRSDSEIAEEAKKYIPDDIEEIDLDAIFDDELSRSNITLR